MSSGAFEYKKKRKKCMVGQKGECLCRQKVEGKKKRRRRIRGRIEGKDGQGYTKDEGPGGKDMAHKVRNCTTITVGRAGKRKVVSQLLRKTIMLGLQEKEEQREEICEAECSEVMAKREKKERKERVRCDAG